MREFAILAGLPGSGKSTLARQLKTERGFFVVSTDGLRFALNAGIYPQEGPDGEYDDLDQVVWKVAEQAVVEFIQMERPVAIDATNIKKARRRRWSDLVHSVAPDIKVTLWWCVGTWDSPERWWKERGYNLEQYRRVRTKLESSIELPTDEEGFEIRVCPLGCSLT
jgi:predicted kinase